MASVSFAQNTYAGEVLEDLLTYTAQGNDTYKEGLIHIKSGIQYKYTLPSVSLGDIIQDNKPTPTALRIPKEHIRSVNVIWNRRISWST